MLSRDHAASHKHCEAWMFMKQQLPLAFFVFINSHLYTRSKFTFGPSLHLSLHPKQRGGAGAFESSEKEIHTMRRVSDDSRTLLRT